MRLEYRYCVASLVIAPFSLLLGVRYGWVHALPPCLTLLAGLLYLKIPHLGPARKWWFSLISLGILVLIVVARAREESPSSALILQVAATFAFGWAIRMPRSGKTIENLERPVKSGEL